MAWDNWESANQKGILHDWFGEHIWLFLVDPPLEVRAKYEETGGHRPSPDRSGLTVAEAIVWFPGLVAAEIMGQVSVICGLTIVHLYVHSSRLTVLL